MDLPQFDDAVEEGDRPVLGENPGDGTECVALRIVGKTLRAL